MNDDTLVLSRHKLDVDDYMRMVDAGILGKADRVELIDGEIIDLGPIGQDHAATVNGLLNLDRGVRGAGDRLDAEPGAA